MNGENVSLPSAAKPSTLQNEEGFKSGSAKSFRNLKRKRYSAPPKDCDTFPCSRRRSCDGVSELRRSFDPFTEEVSPTDLSTRHGNKKSPSAGEFIRRTERLEAVGRSLDEGIFPLKTTRALDLKSEKKPQLPGAWLQATPNVEGARLEAISLLCFRFEQATRKHLGRCWANKFEEFLLCHDHSEDPLLPSDNDATSFLISHLIATGIEKPTVHQVVFSLLTHLREARRSIMTAATLSSSNGELPQLVTVFDNSKREPRVIMSLGRAKVEMHTEYFDKLRRLFAMTSKKSTPFSSRDETIFQSATFSLLCRYTAAQGGMYHISGGHHAALHGAVFDILRFGLNVEAECFASPLNCRLHQYCSLFPDTDTIFGSVGSFFAFFPSEGSFECNPPFEEGIVLRSAKHVLLLLKRSEEFEKALSFTVITPYWPGRLAWETFACSLYTSHIEIITRKNHGYLDGAQHTKRKRYRSASSDTTVFFLQSPAGKKRFPVTANLLRSLKVAFMPHA